LSLLRGKAIRTILDGVAVPQNEVIPNDERHRHFGKGQTETEVMLSPG
jgi:hypothetical protein